MERRRSAGSLLAVSATILALASQACGPATNYPTMPATVFVPTIVGVVQNVSLHGSGWLLTLTDGRTVDEPNETGVTLLGGDSGQPGGLVLASTTSPEFVDVIEPIAWTAGDCWEPWVIQAINRIAWDMGDSILFPDGLELPKAPGFASEVPSHDVDGRQAWTNDGQSEQPYEMCVDSSGQIEWIKLS